MIRYHLISEEETFGYRLKSCIESCRSAVIATAFLTKAGVAEIEGQICAALDNGAHITFLIGRYEYVTEPKAIRKLLTIQKSYQGRKGNLKIFFDADYEFHFKLSLFRINRGYTVIIGSSNLTGKGLSSRGEDNLEIEGHKGLYNQHLSLLKERISTKLEASKQIDEYAKEYARYKKLRRARNRANNRGANLWTKRRAISHSEVTASSFPFCFVDSYEKDKTLIKHIKQATEPNIPNQWISFEVKKHAQEYGANIEIVVCDATGKNIGIAWCYKKILLKDSSGKERPVIFYRYKQGWKLKCKSEKNFKRAMKLLRVSNERSKPVGTNFLERFRRMVR